MVPSTLLPVEGRAKSPRVPRWSGWASPGDCTNSASVASARQPIPPSYSAKVASTGREPSTGRHGLSDVGTVASPDQHEQGQHGLILQVNVATVQHYLSIGERAASHQGRVQG